jgi:hypothetical protein
MIEAMHGILYEEANVLQFLFISFVLGGAAAWMTGMAVARTWGSRLTLIIYLLLLGWGVRFIHFALFEGSMRSLQFYAVDTVILLVFGLLGFQVARTSQMVTQYYWLYEQQSLVSWQKRN